MMTGKVSVFLSTALTLFLSVLPAQAMEYVGPPILDDKVSVGLLPPVEQRLPAVPFVADLESRGQVPGRQGGSLTMLMKSAKDTRQMYVYGYARLVKYDLDFNLVPDILESYEETDGGRTFTLHLRPGHKWSDGAPFTTADFLYFWEDMALNEDLYASGPPTYLQVMGQPAQVEALDETTIRYHFPMPNPDFLPGLAQAIPSQIYAPKHYLSQFHPNYRPLEELMAEAEAAGQRNWAAVHLKNGRYYRYEKVDLPTLQPWVVQNEAPADRFIFTRNPYYYKVDSNGLQLPYFDEVIFNVTEEKLISGKAATGDVDLQARYLRFDDVTLLKRNEASHDYDTYLWRIAKGAHQAILPNLTVKDPVFRELIRDVRFRRALSLGINRHEINRVIYFGLAVEGQNTMLPQSPLYKEQYRSEWAQFDLKQANALLDEMGLKRNWDGARLGPDGKPIEIIVETSGSTEQADILELITDSWWELGIKIFTKPLSKETLQRRIFSGQTQMTMDSGFENGLATADMAPNDLAPVTQAQYQWSEWGEYFETNQNGGNAPDMDIGTALMDLRQQWYLAETKDDRKKIWHQMLQLHADKLPTIGLVAGVMQPVVVAKGLRNIPTEGLWNWDPGAHFGLYGMDYFFWDKDSLTAQATD